MPDSFRLEEHGLKTLRTDTFAGLVFGTLSPEAPPLSDYIGRKPTYAIFFVLGAALYAAIPTTGHMGSVTLFVLACAVLLSMYGGGFATIPAYLRDLFGTLQVGAIHGRLLTALHGVFPPGVADHGLTQGAAPASSSAMMRAETSA